MGNALPCPECERRFGSVDALAMHTRMTHRNPSWIASKNHRPGPISPVCPTCERPATITPTRYGPRAACCGLHSWGYKPLVDPAVHQARNAAHAAFDPTWQRGALSRGEAYRRLQMATGMTSVECHISLMNAEQAWRVVDIVRGGLLTEAA